MATKTLHTVEVDASQFQAFYDLFRKYSAELKDLPDDWKKVTGEMDGASGPMKDFEKATGATKASLAIAAAQASTIAGAIRDVTKGTQDGTKAQKDFLASVRSSGHAMKAMAKDAKSLGASIFGIGRFLMGIGGTGLRFAGIGSLLSGGMGLLSMLGLRGMARSAVSGQSEARSLGVSVGQLDAFRTDFGRYADPSILNRVAQAQGTLSQWAFLSMATGISPDKVSTMSPAEMSIAMMRRARTWWDRTPANLRSVETLRTTGLDQFFSFDEVRRLGAMSGKEFSDASKQFSGDARALNQSDRTIDAWYQFERQLRLAGQTINADFTRRLAGLGPSLGRLEQAITKDGLYLVDKLLTPANVTAIANGIDSFTHYLGSPEFKSDMQKFGEFIRDAVGGLKSFAMWLQKMFGGPGQTDTGPMGAVPGTGINLDGSAGSWIQHGYSHLGSGVTQQQIDQFKATEPKSSLWDQTKGVLGDVGYGINSGIHHFFDETIPQSWYKMPDNSKTMQEKEQYLSSLEKKYQLPAGLLDTVWARESSRGKKMKSSKGAIGDFGIMPITARQYGLDLGTADFYTSGNTAAHYLSDLNKQFGGNIDKTLAAYNWGPGNLSKNLQKNGANWGQNLPSETRDYISSILTVMAQRQAIKLDVHVTNNTGANVAISTNAGSIS